MLCFARCEMMWNPLWTPGDAAHPGPRRGRARAGRAGLCSLCCPPRDLRPRPLLPGPGPRGLSLHRSPALLRRGRHDTSGWVCEETGGPKAPGLSGAPAGHPRGSGRLWEGPDPGRTGEGPRAAGSSVGPATLSKTPSVLSEPQLPPCARRTWALSLSRAYLPRPLGGLHGELAWGPGPSCPAKPAGVFLRDRHGSPGLRQGPQPTPRAACPGLGPGARRAPALPLPSPSPAGSRP